VIVWSGWGILAVLIAAVGGALGAVAGGEHHSNLGMGIGLVAVAPAIWLLGKRLNDPEKGRVLVDPQTGQQVIMQRTHTLFWVKMEYWGAIVALFGALVIVTRLLPGSTG